MGMPSQLRTASRSKKALNLTIALDVDDRASHLALVARLTHDQIILLYGIDHRRLSGSAVLFYQISS